MKRFAWTIVLVLSPMFYATVFACGCPKLPNRTSEGIKIERIGAFKSAAAVFSGEVIELEQNKVRFKVEKIWKGDSVDEIAMVIQLRKYNGKSVNTSCDYHFEMGKKYLVYAYRDSDELSTHACSRTTPLTQVQRAEEEMKGLNEIQSPEIRNTKSNHHFF